jgi:hypothetical protein
MNPFANKKPLLNEQGFFVGWGLCLVPGLPFRNANCLCQGDVRSALPTFPSHLDWIMAQKSSFSFLLVFSFFPILEQ